MKCPECGYNLEFYFNSFPLLDRTGNCIGEKCQGANGYQDCVIWMSGHGKCPTFSQKQLDCMVKI